ncbi:Alpha/Beta hydrolase protein [Aspergillus cavernicola]|uniref:Alpha/Beta hydrolase protein n=1 Tax=Aspergillus cavernicola TaxID=176166 RepID=A0ABR4IV13_9EURO
MDDPKVPHPPQSLSLTPGPQVGPKPDSIGHPASTFLRPHSYGLAVIHEPPQAEVDIVLLHGLMGDAYRTWHHRDPDVYWPRDFLIHDFQDARIMVFGYDVAVWHPWNQVSQGWLSGYAADLLGSLSGRRDDKTRTRPLLFIAHSLGGLVVQQALISARESRTDHLQDIETRTVGICFLGTPHRGTNLATWGERFARVLNIFKPVNCQIVSLLGPRSKALHEMRRSFHNILEKRKDEGSRIRIVCFYETVPMVRSCIVSEDSATIDGEPSYPIFANHVDMVRFGSRQDNGYMSIVREIHHLISGKGSSYLCPGCGKHRTSDLR